MKSVQFVSASHRYVQEHPGVDAGDVSGGWRAQIRLGAPALGGLALPAAHPTESWLYAPRGVHLGTFRGQDILVAADTGNHRIMIWHGIPDRDEQPCDLVLGQPDATSEGPAGGCGNTRSGMFLPTGVLVHDDMLIVADAWHHRVLIYHDVPTAGDTEPDVILGQPDPQSVAANRGGDCALNSLYWPFGVAVVGGRFYVADTGNRRVLGWSGGVPKSGGVAPDLVLGQPDAAGRDENRGGAAAANSFRWPHDICGNDDLLLVADAGNHRVLGWAPHPEVDLGATLVLGQSDFAKCTEWPYAPQRADLMRFPYATDIDGTRLAVADTANNRILIWDTIPTAGFGGAGPPADAVLAQPTFAANGENHWDSIEQDSLCWPYGLSMRGDRMAIADSGNNRIVLWRRE